MSKHAGHVALAMALLIAGGCAQKSAPLPAPVPSASAKMTVDRLLPGELGEGTARALGLAVPREMRIERVFADSFVARGHVDVEPLANYVRRRVEAASVEIGAARTLFSRAHVKGEPDAKLVRIEVVRDNDSSLLIVRDITPPPVAPGLSDDERWRKAGVVPGKPFDPKAL
jgi:hypothetical protein